MADGLVAPGGDGTMRLVTRRPVPVLGVNHGNLGLPVEVSPRELDAALAKVVSSRTRAR